MQIKNCLITAAGLGTRMGSIGEVLPKPLWPIFEMSLLDLQLKYVKRFNAQRIFVNSHHCSDQVLEWAHKNDVIVLDEPILLGSGGCVHNLKKYLDSNEDEVTCIVNSDQFFMLEEKHIQEGLQEIKKGMEVVVYGMCVDKSQKYNETYCENNKLLDIRKSNGEKNYYTYSGVCLINLTRLNYVEGESAFFQTVCNYKENKKIYFYDDTKTVDFCDFGEKSKYVNSLCNIIKNNNSVFQNFIRENNVIAANKKYYDEDNQILYSGELKINLRDRIIQRNELIDHY